MTCTIAVAYITPEKAALAQALAQELQLPLLGEQAEQSNYDYLLLLTPDFLGLQKTSETKAKPFYIDFSAGKIRYRSTQAGLRSERLARAIGIKPKQNPHIMDATAGLGRDSFILASLGFKVTLLERSPILFALLRDALARAHNHVDLAPVVQRLQLHHADALHFFSNTANRPDVIYLDPMFPERKKSAAVKKEMVILQDILGDDPDSDRLLKLALTCATQRVVVKRPRLAPPLAELAPNFSMPGTSCRFDIYLV